MAPHLPCRGEVLCGQRVDTSAEDCSDASVEVLDDLAGARVLLGRHHQVDVSMAEPVERVIGNAGRLDTQGSKLITPRHGRSLVLERGHGLP